MKVFDALTAEHRVLSRLVRMLDRSARGGTPSRIRERLSLIFDVLAPALESHEEIEEALLGIPTYAVESVARRDIETAAAGHTRLDGMIRDFQKALRRPARARTSLAPRVQALSSLLRLHFRAEELGLWPHYRRAWRKMSPAVHDFFYATHRKHLLTLKMDIRRLTALEKKP